MAKTCPNCNQLHLKKEFASAIDLQETIGELKQLKNFSVIRKRPLNVLEGGWDDIVEITIKCNLCNKTYCCHADTYHGRGSFEED